MLKLRYVSTFGLIVLVALCFAANDADAEVGVTDNSILVGCSNSFSGPLVYPGTQLVNNGLEAYIGYVNAQGGVNGRKIKTQYYDDGYKPQNAVGNTKRLVEQDKVFAILASQGTGPVMATVKYLTQNKVPLLFPFQGAPISGQKTLSPGWLKSKVTNASESCIRTMHMVPPSRIQVKKHSKNWG
jgi:ABC-type branched-subunit amino acid transport system substrate-binding protein